MHKRVGAILAATSLVVALASTLPQSAIAADASSGAPSSPVATYTLITGDRVAVSTAPDGRPEVTLVSSPGGARAIQVIASGPHLYVLPNDAAGFIGQPLDLSLFDVNAVQPSTQPALSVEFTSDSAHRLPPGIAKSGTHTYAPSDPAAFGTSLAAAWHSLKTNGTANGLFAGIAKITRSGATAEPSAQTPPPGKLFTVTVKAFDRRGHRVTGDAGVLSNADDTDLFLAGQAFYKGEFAFSVPAGH